VNPEQQHVLTLLQDKPGDQAVGRLRALNEADWDSVIAAAEALDVAPLLERGVDRLGIEAPASVRQRLRVTLEGHTARNLRMLHEFARLAREMQEADLRFMPFKGVHLCTGLYENIGERPTWDIDLLIQLGQVRAVMEAAQKCGYRPCRPFDLELEVRNYHHLPAFVKREAPPLELHWTLLNPRFKNGLNWQELWERSVPSQIGGVETRVFSPDDLLVYLCAHVAYQHIYIDSVRSLHDIKLLVGRWGDQLDWGAINARAKTWGLSHSVYLTLRLVDDLLGCPLPDGVREALRPRSFNERLVQAALTRLVDHSATSPVVSAVWSRRSLLKRLGGLWERIMVPRSVLAGRYRLRPGSWKIPFYYIVRARDLLGVHGRDLLNLLFGRRNRREAARRESELIAYLNWWQ
jgi:hypothetical protein